MPRISRTDALEDIAGWSTVKVVALLQKNGVEEACWKAVEKRQIDGDELLHLTEGKLALWKSDLTRPLIWNLWTFVEELRKSPESYVEDKETEQQQQQQQQQEQQHEKEQQEQLQPPNQQLETEALSDTGSWDTDFEDSADDGGTTDTMSNPDFRNSLRIFQENDKIKLEADARGSSYSINRTGRNSATPITESTYANCELTTPEIESTYANIGEPARNVSRLHQKSLAEKLKEQLLLMGTPAKPAIAPKPEGICIKRTGEPRSSFLHKKFNGVGNTQKKMNVPPPPEPQSIQEDALRSLPKPPVTIRGFDLVANLPTTQNVDESDDEEDYEAFDEQIVRQNRRDSGQSFVNARQNSVESVYRPSSSVSHEDEEVYDIYESITESPDENGHDFKNETNTKNVVNPPPLPAKPPPTIITSQNHLNKKDTNSERSLEKKSATLPHSGSNASLTNAARPLPPPPDRQSYYERPWFHNLTREEANLLIEEHCTYGNSHDGYFLMRPSTTNPNNPLTLVLWFKNRVYNVPVRRRIDNRYALGTSKLDEQSFASIDEMVTFYKKEQLVLYTGGVQTGSTKLTDTPSK